MSNRAAIAISYGMYYPSYIMELYRIRNSQGYNPNHRSLLLGAYTADTAIEYTATVRSVYPNAQTHILDLEAAETEDKPGLLLANATKIPFAEGSFSSIHTNYLLHQLVGVNDPRTGISDLFKESRRTLQIGGSLIMCEGRLADRLGVSEPEQVAHMFRNIARSAGFSSTRIEPAYAFVSRQDMASHYRSSEGLSTMNTINRKGTYLIVATK